MNLIICEKRGRKVANFRERILFLQSEKDVTLDDIARAVGTNQSSLSKVINGRLNLKADLLESLAKYFDVDKSYLLGETDIRKKKTNLPPDYLAFAEEVYEKGISPNTIRDLLDYIAKHRPRE